MHQATSQTFHLRDSLPPVDQSPLIEGLTKHFTDGIVFKNNTITCNRKGLENWFKQFGLKLKSNNEVISVWQDINGNREVEEIKSVIDNLLENVKLAKANNLDEILRKKEESQIKEKEQEELMVKRGERDKIWFTTN